VTYECQNHEMIRGEAGTRHVFTFVCLERKSNIISTKSFVEQTGKLVLVDVDPKYRVGKKYVVTVAEE